MIQPSFGGVGVPIPPRSTSATWPDFVNDYPLPANGTVVNFPGLMHDSGVTRGTTAQSKGGTGNVTWGTGTGYRGRGTIILSAGAGGFARQMIQQVDVTPYMEQGGEGDSSQSDDHAVKRAVVMMAFENTGGFALGCGAHFSAGQIGNPDLYGGAIGFGFQRTAAGVVSVISRAALGAGAVVVHATYAPLNGASDLQKFNAYEVIAVSARAGVDSKIIFKVNGAPIFTAKVGSSPTTGFPTNPMHSTGQYGFGLTLMALNNLNQIAVPKVRYTVGPTERSVMGR